MAIRITCISKDGGYHENPYVAITSLGWSNEQTGAVGRSTRLEIFDFVTNGGDAYVQAGNTKVKLIPEVSAHGTRYVKTRSDGTLADNLLTLSECH